MRGNTLRAIDAVAPSLPPPLPPERRPPMSETNTLLRWKYRRRRGAPPCGRADCRLQWRFLHFRACMRACGGRHKFLKRDDALRMANRPSSELTQAFNISYLYRTGYILMRGGVKLSH
jgi:hypothetical protein